MSHINQSYLLIPSQSLLQCFFKWLATQIQGYVFPCHVVSYNVLLGIQTLIYISNYLLSQGAKYSLG